MFFELRERRVPLKNCRPMASERSSGYLSQGRPSMLCRSGVRATQRTSRPDPEYKRHTSLSWHTNAASRFRRKGGRGCVDAQSCRRVGTLWYTRKWHRSGADEDTEGMKRLVPEPIKDRLRKGIPLGRFGRIADIEQARCFSVRMRRALLWRSTCSRRWSVAGGKPLARLLDTCLISTISFEKFEREARQGQRCSVVRSVLADLQTPVGASCALPEILSTLFSWSPWRRRAHRPLFLSWRRAGNDSPGPRIANFR